VEQRIGATAGQNPTWRRYVRLHAARTHGACGRTMGPSGPIRSTLFHNDELMRILLGSHRFVLLLDVVQLLPGIRSMRAAVRKSL
jgi:hypothetical protein